MTALLRDGGSVFVGVGTGRWRAREVGGKCGMNDAVAHSLMIAPRRRQCLHVGRTSHDLLSSSHRDQRTTVSPS